MKKQSGLFIGIMMVCLLAVSNAYAGGLMGAVGMGLVKGAAEEVGQGVGQVVGAGADWAEEKITGKETFFGGDVKSEAENQTGNIQTGQGAYVSVGSVSINGSRFNDDLTIKTVNKTGSITADDQAFVDIGGVGFSNVKASQKTTVKTENKIGSVHAGKGSMIRVGAFNAY